MKKYRLKSILLLIAIFTAIFIFGSQANAETKFFFVDPDFIGIQSGNETNPWNFLGNLEWETINNALEKDDVIIYFSAREAGNDLSEEYRNNLEVKKDVNLRNHHLTLDGMSKWNSNDSNPKWENYEGLNKFKVIGQSSLGLGWPNNKGLIHDVALKGFDVSGNGARVMFGGNNLIIEDIYSHDITGVGATFQSAGIADENCALINGGEPYSSVIIRNNRIENGYGEGIYLHGLYTWCLNLGAANSDFLIENNFIINAGANGGQGDGIDIKGGMFNITIRKNTIINSSNLGMTVTEVAKESGPQNLVIENNLISKSHNRGTNLMNDDGYRAGVIFRNNIYDSNNGTGIAIGGVGLTENIDIYSNTFYNNSGNAINIAGTNNVIIKNNILIDNNNGGNQFGKWGTNANTSADYNLWVPQAGHSIEGPNAIILPNSNGILMNLANRDFRLASNSPAKDKGINLSFTGFGYDFDGVSRPQGSAWDIGAYEYTGGSNVPSAPQGLSVR